MQDLPEITLDTAALYREELITDRKAGMLRIMTPVTPSGEIDASRSVIYTAQTQLMSQAGPLPISAEIQADSLDQAIQHYDEVINQAIQDTLKELEEMRRKAASQIVVPDGTGGVPAGGPGKIQLR